MTPNEISEAAAALHVAAQSGHYIAPLRDLFPSLDAHSAYEIQKLNIDRQIASGRRRIGCKIGLTAVAVQKQLGVDSPDFGVLLDDMGYGDGDTISVGILAQPRIEAEIAFMMGRDLSTPNPGLADVVNAIEYALPAVEIVGSRIAAWNIRFVDTVADNASSSAYVLGTSPRRLSEFDLRLCGMAMTRRGKPVSVGAGVACLGNPLNAVTWLARKMFALGTPLREGELVLSGALGLMVAVEAGDVFETRINGLGSVRAAFDSSASRSHP